MEPILAPPSSAQETSTVRRRLLAGSIGALLALAACGGGAPPSVEVLQEAVSPDGRHVATAFYCEGGGAAGYTFHNVTLQPSGEELDPMAGLLGKRADGKRLKRHAAVTRATLAYERTGDGARLLRLLEQATPKERRGFMVDTKGSRTKELFDRAESLEITIMELLKRDIHDRTTDL